MSNIISAGLDLFSDGGGSTEQSRSSGTRFNNSETTGQQTGNSSTTQNQRSQSTGLQSLVGNQTATSGFDFSNPQASQLAELVLQGASGDNGTANFFTSLMGNRGPSAEAQQAAEAIRGTANAELPAELADTRRRFFRAPGERGVSALMDTVSRNRANAETSAQNVLLQDSARRDSLALQGAAGLNNLTGTAAQALPMFGTRTQVSENEQQQTQQQQTEQLMQQINEFINNFNSQTQGREDFESTSTGQTDNQLGFRDTMNNVTGTAQGLAALLNSI